MWSKIRSTLIVGIFASAPLALTAYFLIALFNWFDDLFQPFVLKAFGVEQPIAGLGILAGIIFIFLVGLIAPSLLGKHFLLLIDRIVDRVPLAKMVYSGTKQVFETFSKDSFGKFNRVVLVEFPRKGVYSIGFVTSEYAKSISDERPELNLAVFVPTTPNPTGGYLMFFPESDTIPLTLSVEDALKLIISVGIVRPLGPFSSKH